LAFFNWDILSWNILNWLKDALATLYRYNIDVKIPSMGRIISYVEVTKIYMVQRFRQGNIYFFL